MFLEIIAAPDGFILFVRSVLTPLGSYLAVIICDKRMWEIPCWRGGLFGILLSLRSFSKDREGALESMHHWMGVNRIETDVSKAILNAVKYYV